MTAGSIAGTALVVAWSQVHGLAAFYVLWAAIGLVMAAVLYEPAFTVVAKHFPDARRAAARDDRDDAGRRAGQLHLPAALPGADRRARLARRAARARGGARRGHHPASRHSSSAPRRDTSAPPRRRARPRLGTRCARCASGCSQRAFVLASLSTIAMTIFAIPFLLERGHSPAFAAFAVGLIGVSQIPGRLLFAPLAARLPRALATASVFALIALGIAVVVSVHSTAAVLIGLVLLGMGNGMATLARATAIADLYGSGAYGTIAGVAGGMTTAARAAGPFAAALYAAAVGYTTLLWTLAAPRPCRGRARPPRRARTHMIATRRHRRHRRRPSPALPPRTPPAGLDSRPCCLRPAREPVGSWPDYYDSLTLFSPARYSRAAGPSLRRRPRPLPDTRRGRRVPARIRGRPRRRHPQRRAGRAWQRARRRTGRANASGLERALTASCRRDRQLRLTAPASASRAWTASPAP